MRDIRDLIADRMHTSWSRWTSWVFTCSVPDAEGGHVIPKEKVERWKRQLNTPYSQLSEEEKKSDLWEADMILTAPGVVDGIMKEYAKLCKCKSENEPIKALVFNDDFHQCDKCKGLMPIG